MNKNKIFALLVAIILLVLNTTTASAQDSNKLSQEIYYEFLSPFCPGRALADCPSEQATKLKEKIKTDLNSGKSKEEVFNQLLNEYGQQYKAVPDMSGLNSLAWITPIALIIAGIIFLIFKMRGNESD